MSVPIYYKLGRKYHDEASIKKLAQNAAKEIGLPSRDSVIGKTSVEQYYFIKGVKTHR
jgi:hypothetical protein